MHAVRQEDLYPLADLAKRPTSRTRPKGPPRNMRKSGGGRPGSIDRGRVRRSQYPGGRGGCPMSAKSGDPCPPGLIPLTQNGWTSTFDLSLKQASGQPSSALEVADRADTGPLARVSALSGVAPAVPASSTHPPHVRRVNYPLALCCR
jgi:hypothetical protein